MELVQALDSEKELERELAQVPELELVAQERALAEEMELGKVKEMEKVLEKVQGPEMEEKVQEPVQLMAVLYLRHPIARSVESQGPAPELVPEV
jgi:hypothetical protein